VRAPTSRHARLAEAFLKQPATSGPGLADP